MLQTVVFGVKSDSHVAGDQIDIRRATNRLTFIEIAHLLLLSWFWNMDCQDHAERPQPDILMSFILHGLVLLGCHSQFALYHYSFASYLYSCKINFTTIRCVDSMNAFQCGILLYQCFSNEIVINNDLCQPIVILYKPLSLRIW